VSIMLYTCASVTIILADGLLPIWFKRKQSGVHNAWENESRLTCNCNFLWSIQSIKQLYLSFPCRQSLAVWNPKFLPLIWTFDIYSACIIQGSFWFQIPEIQRDPSFKRLFVYYNLTGLLDYSVVKFLPLLHILALKLGTSNTFAPKW
jgi:hypothetical protein